VHQLTLTISQFTFTVTAYVVQIELKLASYVIISAFATERRSFFTFL